VLQSPRAKVLIGKEGIRGGGSVGETDNLRGTNLPFMIATLPPGGHAEPVSQMKGLYRTKKV